MRKTIIALILSTTAVAANAGDYSQQVYADQICEMVASYALDAFDNKSTREPLPVTPEDVGSMYAAVKFAKKYGYSSAISQKDAWMTSWAKCQDNIDYLQNYKKNTGRIAEDLHY